MDYHIHMTINPRYTLYPAGIHREKCSFYSECTGKYFAGLTALPNICFAEWPVWMVCGVPYVNNTQ
jgi:hypothetical protein